MEIRTGGGIRSAGGAGLALVIALALSSPALTGTALADPQQAGPGKTKPGDPASDKPGDKTPEKVPDKVLDKALRALVEQLKVPEERLEAKKALEAKGAAAAGVLPELEALARGKDDGTAHAAIAIMGHLGEAAFPSLLSITRGALRVRLDLAADALARIGPKLNDRLFRTYVEGAKNERYVAWVALTARRPLTRGAREALARGVEDPDIRIKSRAGKLAAELGASLAPELLKALRGREGALAFATMDLLKRCRDQIGELLLESLDSDDAAIRLAAVTHLPVDKVDAAAALPKLIPLLGAKDFEPGYQARRRLEELGAKAVDAVSAALSDSAPKVRARAAQILGAAGKDARAAVPALIKALDDKDLNVRLKAAFALPEIPGAGPAVAQHFASGEGNRISAALARAAMGPEGADAVPTLLPVLDSAKRDERWLVYNTLRALGRVGPAADTAGPKLQGLLDHKDSLYADTAAAALGRIDPTNPALLGTLQKWLKARSFARQYRAAETLVSFAPEHPALVEWLGRRLPSARRPEIARLRRIIVKMGAAARPLLPRMITLIDSGKPQHAPDVLLRILGELGLNSPEVLQCLDRAASSKIAVISEAARKARQSLVDKAAPKK